MNSAALTAEDRISNLKGQAGYRELAIDAEWFMSYSDGDDIEVGIELEVHCLVDCNSLDGVSVVVVDGNGYEVDVCEQVLDLIRTELERCEDAADRYADEVVCHA